MYYYNQVNIESCGEYWRRGYTTGYCSAPCGATLVSGASPTRHPPQPRNKSNEKRTKCKREAVPRSALCRCDRHGTRNQPSNRHLVTVCPLSLTGGGTAHHKASKQAAGAGQPGTALPPWSPLTLRTRAATTAVPGQKSGLLSEHLPMVDDQTGHAEHNKTKKQRQNPGRSDEVFSEYKSL